MTDDMSTIEVGGINCVMVLQWPLSMNGVKCTGTCGL